MRLIGLLALVAGCAAADPARHVCSYGLPSAYTFQTTPVLSGRTLLITTASNTRAVDALTCREQWRWDHWNAGKGMPANRGGVATGDAFIRGTPDGHLVALDIATGQPKWLRRIADPARFETLTMQPLVHDTVIVIGTAGAEDGVAGWVGGFNTRDGRELWRFRTAAHGGSVWTRASVDSATRTVFVATGNAAPDFAPELRAESSPYTNAVLALSLDSGELRWSRQFDAEDSHDWDLTIAGPVIGNTVIAGGKDGVLRALNTHDGRVIWSTPLVRRVNIAQPPSRTGVYVCPGVFGGMLWAQPAVWSGMIYVGTVELCGRFYRDDSPKLGGFFKPEGNGRGAVVAVDGTTGAIRWRYPTRSPVVAGIAVAGDTVYAAELGGVLYAIRAADGQVLSSRRFSGTIGGALVVDHSHLIVPRGSASWMLPGGSRGDPQVTIIPR